MNQRTSTTPALAAAALGLAVAWLSAPSLAHAQSARARARATRRNEAAAPLVQSPSPISLQVALSPTSLHGAFSLENTSGAPVEIVADRRLLRLELQPSSSAAPEPVRPGRRGRRATAPRAVICRSPLRPATNEQATHVRLAPGARYSEGFDVRDLCGVTLPSGFVPGATVAVRYGFETARGFAHAIALDNQDPPVVDIATASPLVLSGEASAWPPRGAPAALGDARLAVTVGGDVSAARIADARVTVRVRVQGHYALWLFDRPGQIRFDVTGPRGESIQCRRGFREYNPIRDFFVRRDHGQGLTETLVLGNLCPGEQFAVPGIYRVQAVFETRASGERFGLQSFTGISGSPFFFLRIERGATPGPYQRLPVEDPFDPRSPERDEASPRP